VQSQQVVETSDRDDELTLDDDRDEDEDEETQQQL